MKIKRIKKKRAEVKKVRAKKTGKMKCRFCGLRWLPRKRIVRACPKCKRYLI